MTSNTVRILGTTTSVIILAPWLFISMMSALIFDSPGSAYVIWTQVIFYATWSYGPMTLIGLILAWKNKHQPKSNLYFLLPLICIFILAIGVMGLNYFCNGKFNCL
mgnify:CR=1 FL=1